jgi:hypothetical protein
MPRAAGICLCLWVGLLIPRPAAGIARLIIIPTARTIGARNYEAKLQYDRLYLFAQHKEAIAAKFGIGARAESQLTYDFSGNRVLGDVKYGFPLLRAGNTALAVGLDGIGAGAKASGYLVAGGYVGPVEVTVGYARDSSRRSFLAGLDASVSDRLILMADYKSGKGEVASVGLQYTFARHLLFKGGVRFTQELEANRVGLEIKYFNRY